MAEIIQQETQEAQALKSKASPFTAKAHAPQPLREAGYNKRLEADGWGKATVAIDRSAKIIQAYSHAQDTLIANETMKLMDSDHNNVMLGLAENLHQTDITNLDLQDTVAKWENRHADNSDGFRIGKSDSNGKPTHQIHSQKLEDYNIPHSQKDFLEKHYNGLEKQKTDYLIQAMPEILIGKAKFQLGAKSTDLKNRAAGIVNLQTNYQHETPPGLENLLDARQELDLQGNEIEKTYPVTPATVYTLNLTNSANEQLLDLFEEYDKELLKVMETGVISAEEAIVHQRVFTQDVLKEMFDADVSRDEDGAYLKLGNGGYHIDRNLLRGHTTPNKLQQLMHIDAKSTSAFVNNYNSKKQVEEDKAAKLIKTNQTKSNIEDFTREVQKKESFSNMSYGEIVNGYVKAGADEFQAKIYANVWEVNKTMHDDGIIDDNVTFQVQTLANEMVNDPDLFEAMFSRTDKKTGQVFALQGRPLKMAVVALAEKRLRQKKWQAMSAGDKKAVDVNNITLERHELELIEKTAAKIKPSNIQPMLNTRQVHKKELRKKFLIGAIERQTGSATGRNDIKTRYLKFDHSRDIYGPDPDKIDAAYKASGFDTSKEMGLHLNNIAKIINAEDAAEVKRISNLKYVSTNYMTDNMFKRSMWADAEQKKEIIANIATGNTTLFAAHSEDASKSFFNANAESYLKTAQGQKDANFKARYEGAGISGVLTPRQQALKTTMDRSFDQLMGMELALVKKKNTTKEVLEGYYLELQKNLSKTDVHNKYTDAVARSIKGRLYARVQQLQLRNQKGTAFRQCLEDGKINEVCIATFEKAHGNRMADLPGSITREKIVMEIIKDIHNLTEPMEPPPQGEEYGQGVNNG